MTRIQRQIAHETRLAYDHYRERRLFHKYRIMSGCPECARHVLALTHALSTRWFKVDVEALFRRGRTTGVCKPVHR